MKCMKNKKIVRILGTILFVSSSLVAMEVTVEEDVPVRRNYDIRPNFEGKSILQAANVDIWKGSDLNMKGRHKNWLTEKRVKENMPDDQNQIPITIVQSIDTEDRNIRMKQEKKDHTFSRICCNKF